jgi:hypothetical protein
MKVLLQFMSVWMVVVLGCLLLNGLVAEGRSFRTYQDQNKRLQNRALQQDHLKSQKRSINSTEFRYYSDATAGGCFQSAITPIGH